MLRVSGAAGADFRIGELSDAVATSSSFRKTLELMADGVQ